MSALIKHFGIVCLVCILCGCQKLAPEPKKPLSEAHQNFLDALNAEESIDAQVTQLERTLWVYVPTETELVRIKPKENTTGGMGGIGSIVTEAAIKEFYGLDYIKGEYQDGEFLFEYVVNLKKSYPAEDVTYSSDYSEEYKKIQKVLIETVAKTYFDIEQDDAPDFLVFVITDIVRGLEIEIILKYSDLIKAHGMAPSLPADEFNKRIVSELRGNKSFIDDKEGKHLPLKEVVLPEFLVKQMVNRLKARYTKSIFPPSGKSNEEILTVIKQTLESYEFTDFRKVTLNNVDDGSSYSVKADELMQMKDLLEKPKGRFHFIEFN